MNAEVLAFVLYFVLMLAIGVVFFFKERGAGEKEYFLGGRHMGPWVTAMSAQASDMSAWLQIAFVDTFSFQAPAFYKKHDYREVFTLEEYPYTGRRHYYTKKLL